MQQHKTMDYTIDRPSTCKYAYQVQFIWCWYTTVGQNKSETKETKGSAAKNAAQVAGLYFVYP